MTLQGSAEVCSTLVGRLFRHGAVITAVALTLTMAQSVLAQCPTCSTSPCTISGTSTIGSGVTCNYSGKDVILTGTLQGDNNASCYTVIADNLTVRGTLRARSSCVIVNVSGNFKTEVVSNSAATVDVRAANSPGDGVFVTCGTATINGKDINANADGSQTPIPPNPNTYYPSGDIDIECTGNITGTGGPIHATALTGDDGGTITVVSSGGSVNLSSAMDVNGAGDFSFGGAIEVDAAGSVTLGSSSHSLEAQSAQGGFAGTIDVTSGGAIAINGALNVNGNGLDSDGGAITIDGASVTTGTSWNARGDQGGDGGSIDVTAESGTVSTTVGSASWNVSGASHPDDGGWGGGITISATGTVSLSGDMDAAGNGDSASGGVISIATDGDITQESTSRIEADSSGTDASNGSIDMSACNMTVKGDIDTRNTGLDDVGENDFDYGGTFTQNSGSSVLADDGGGNNFFCRCVDTSPADGVCDTPLTCVSNPSTSGTLTPSATLFPVMRSACPVSRATARS